jgi:hypothetical protein
MMNRLMIVLVVPLILAVPRPALAASATAVFDTVDSVELDQVDDCNGGCFIHAVVVVTGIRKGQTTPTTQSFNFGDKGDMAVHCQRLAMVAMSKPGKYRFGIGADVNITQNGHGACSLTLVNP